MRSLAVSILLLAGCDFYFNDGDDDPPCTLEEKGDIAQNELRNPQTGECQGFGGGTCNDRCGPCPAETDQAIPDWGSCFSQCEGLAEAGCKATTGCYAAYTEFPTQDRRAEFRGCWQTAPSGPIGGSCENLDAQSCSRHDNCTAHYVDDPAADPSGRFSFCKAEVTITPVACETLATESACVGRTDCEPVYKGDNCTCTPTDCDCQILTYQRCQAK
jgi:hypothetical protein